MSTDILIWVVLGVVITTMLALDLFVVQREAHEVSIREAAAWSVVWIALGLGFGALVATWRGAQAGGEYLAGYVIEKSLSMDNVFVFAMLFAAFAVPGVYQHRVLLWGVLGAIVLRGVFIFAGTAMLDAVHWLIYGFGLLLIVTGVRMARSEGHAIDAEENRIFRLVRRFVPMTTEYRGEHLFTRIDGRRLATPLFAVVIVVGATDVMFAIDSIPAVFAITTDPFLVFSSNAFAILGLRSLYFLLAGLLPRFRYLKAGLAALLVFAGAKILLAPVVKLPIPLSLGVILAILAGAIGASLWATRDAAASHPEAV